MLSEFSNDANGKFVQCRCAEATNLSAIFYIFENYEVRFVERGAQRRLSSRKKNDYKKPRDVDSSRDCFRVAQRIRKSYTETDNGGHIGCMACDPTIGFPDTRCPTPSGISYPCQDLINQLFRHCKGKRHAWPVPDEKPKTMPDGYFFDPLDEITGTWGKRVKAAVKISAERCGCNSATRAGKQALLPILLVLLSFCWHVFFGW